MYREVTPSTDPYGLYDCVWSRDIGTHQHKALVVPDGCMDVIWHRESGELFVAGPDTRPHLAPVSAGTLIGLRFSPGSAPTGLGVPADPLRNGRAPLDALWSVAEVRRLGGALAAAGTDADAQRVLERWVAGRAGGARDPVVTAVLNLSRRDGNVGSIAAAVGLSERQLHRRCLPAFGYGAKVLHRVLRFNRALGMARAGVRFADIAYRVGYADQAHLSREVRALGGTTLTTLLAGPAGARQEAEVTR